MSTEGLKFFFDTHLCLCSELQVGRLTRQIHWCGAGDVVVQDSTQKEKRNRGKVETKAFIRKRGGRG